MNPKHATLALVGALLTLAVGCRSLDLREEQEELWPEVVEAELGSMLNVHQCGTFWFGGRPSQEDLDLASRRGVKTIVNATTPTECVEYDLQSVCNGFELGIVDLTVADEGMSDEDVDFFLQQVDGAPEGDVLLFCGNGSRAAALFAIYRATRVGVPVDEAVMEARRAGMRPGAPETFVRRQVARLGQASCPVAQAGAVEAGSRRERSRR